MRYNIYYGNYVQVTATLEEICAVSADMNVALRELFEM